MRSASARPVPRAGERDVERLSMAPVEQYDWAEANELQAENDRLETASRRRACAADTKLKQLNVLRDELAEFDEGEREREAATSGSWRGRCRRTSRRRSLRTARHPWRREAGPAASRGAARVGAARPRERPTGRRTMLTSRMSFNAAHVAANAAGVSE